ncbi:MAG: zinc-ribbon domain-containing protein, partial [Armatimonadetes bacterium]|nr:zinc-ribbon domain-containing protein [Armatimonadota bacterium]
MVLKRVEVGAHRKQRLPICRWCRCGTARVKMVAGVSGQVARQCPTCGYEVQAGDLYCSRCGAKLRGRQPSATMEALAAEYRERVKDHPNDADAHYSL